MIEAIWKRGLVVAVLGPALLAPLPFGSQEIFWSALWVFPLAIGVLGFNPGKAARGEILVVLFLMALALAVAAVAVLQRTPGLWPENPIWRRAGSVFGADLTGRGGISVRWPWLDLLPAMLPALALVGGMTLPRPRWRSRQILRGIGAVGLAYALFWLMLYLRDPQAVLWRLKTHHVEVLTGTFLNRNMAAAFLGLAFVAAVLLVIDSACKRFEMRASGDEGRGLSGSQGGFFFDLTTILVCFATMSLTLSRAGLGLALLASAFAMVLRFRLLPSGISKVATRSAAALFVLMTVLFAALALNDLSVRIAETERVDAYRLEVYKASVRIIADHWPIGVGIGRFVDVFPAYRSDLMSASGVWDRAHNTYLQIGVEAGVPVLLGLLGLVALLYGTIVRASLRDGKPNILAIFGASAFLMPILHSLVDYPAQIPGYSIPLATLVGFVLVHTRAPRLLQKTEAP